MNLDHINTIEDFKQRVPALISCGGEDSNNELEEIFKRFMNGVNQKKCRSKSRYDNLRKALMRSIARIERYNQPLTLENVVNSLRYCQYDDDGFLVIENIEYDHSKKEECVYWYDGNGKERIIPTARLKERLDGYGVKLLKPT